MIQKKEYILDGLGCANCAGKIESAISKIPGITEATVNFMTATLIVLQEDSADHFLEIEKIVKSIESHVKVIEKKKGEKRPVPAGASSQKPMTCSISGDKIENQNENQNENRNENKIENKKPKADVISLGGMTSTPKKIKSAVDENTVEAVFLDETDSRPQKSKIERFFELVDKKKFVRISAGAILFLIGIALHFSHVLDSATPETSHFSYLFEFGLFVISYILVGGDVVLNAIRGISKGQVFDENFLMAIATLGAFVIGEFPESVAVMLFYQVGEFFQEAAVKKSRKSISELMNIRPDHANLKLDSGAFLRVSSQEVSVGSTILIKPGEKVPLDGKIISGESLVDTSALTGESVPRTLRPGDLVLSGSINQNKMLLVQVEKPYEDSTVSKILEMVENASSKKAPTEKFITKFSRYYTPVVVVLAALISFAPPLLLPDATLNEWVYRGLVFLVISCPCALVISIPLGYFGGIGAASKHGILVKGSNYLEGLNSVKTVVFDKTGTLTKGVFEVVQIQPENGFSKEDVLFYSAAVESFSTHPIALSIERACQKSCPLSEFKDTPVFDYTEFSGLGVKAKTDSKTIWVGNEKFMRQENINVAEFQNIHPRMKLGPNEFFAGDVQTYVFVAIDGVYAGKIIISDAVKEDSKQTISDLKKAGISEIIMLTGDKKSVGDACSTHLGIDRVYSELLPDQKVEMLEKIEREHQIGHENKNENETKSNNENKNENETKSNNENKSKNKNKIAFVGDGINDAPVLARADIGIAMGGIGSDAAIEAADVVLMHGKPSQLVTAFKISKQTIRIVWQNILFAFAVKGIFLLLGAFGIATMWEAVFADVGVTLIAVLNAARMMNFKERE
ncbi:heavy metal translocating P-type ATPase [Methanolapillus ohkumae]|uniref:Potassium-transporting ATPase ATP-binding subunit n=1 Tax=Methanolapillus ohkumae TaxID=3028298 RepID=A0AA96V5N7_9EURY|nr:Potassium-transporting ATPase ATP-binding subunit [Methanosarcinaceae archaeon Am2]